MLSLNQVLVLSAITNVLIIMIMYSDPVLLESEQTVCLHTFLIETRHVQGSRTPEVMLAVILQIN